MTKELRDKIVKMATIASKENKSLGITIGMTFIDGAEACYKLLTEMGQAEFDAKLSYDNFNLWANNLSTDRPLFAKEFIQGARHQHSQDAAQIAALKMEVNRLVYELDKSREDYDEDLNELYKENKILTEGEK